MSALKKARYRVIQFFMNLGKYLIRWRRPKLAEGPGSAARLPLVIKKAGVLRLLIVSGGTTPRLGLLDSLRAGLDAEGVAYICYSGVEPNPTVANVEEALAVYRREDCDGILAFGGGSSLDCAKALCARVVNPTRRLGDMAGIGKVGKRMPPFFAVPTTAGSGSEASIAAVITDEATHHKYAISDPHLVPHYAALDPMLTATLPPRITAETGMDALTHAVEAYTNRFGGATRKTAAEAVALIFQNLPEAYLHGSDLTVRGNMLKASFLAGAAFTRSCVGYCHAVAHTLGGLYGVRHGLANAVLLPVVLAQYGESVHTPLARLADMLRLPGNTRAEKAAAFIAAVRRMNAQMELPAGFDCIRDEDIPQMVAWALAEANPVYPCPQIWGETELRAVIEKIRL